MNALNIVYLTNKINCWGSLISYCFGMPCRAIGKSSVDAQIISVFKYSAFRSQLGSVLSELLLVQLLATKPQIYTELLLLRESPRGVIRVTLVHFVLIFVAISFSVWHAYTEKQFLVEFMFMSFTKKQNIWVVNRTFYVLNKVNIKPPLTL